MKKIMVVYDEEPLYAERLSDYVNRKDKGIFKAQAFTSPEALQEFAKDNEIDVLLTGESGKERVLAGVPQTQTLILSEERPGPGAAKSGGSREIYKYQSGDEIIREVLACYCETPGVEMIYPGFSDKSKRIIGIYSPVGRCGKTSLALSIGQILAKEEKTLFLSLDIYTGFSVLMAERWRRDFSDLLYYYKQGRFHAVRLNSVIYYVGDMAWLPPIRFPDDHCQVTSEEMAGLLETILKDCDYTTIVLDLGSYGKQVLPLLEICGVIYMPVKEDPFSQAKLQEFSEYLEICGKKKLEERIIRLHVPMPPGNRRFERFPQELLWGDMGDFVRGMLKGQSDDRC